MLVHGKIESSSVNGPGERFVIWFSGCTLACKNCWNPLTHPFDISKEVSKDSMIEWLSNLPETLSGGTFSGGEPIQAYEDTLYISKWIKNNRPAWTLGMYTGYTHKELLLGRWQYRKEGDSEVLPIHIGTSAQWQALEPLLDFAIMGRYNQLLPNPSSSPLTTTSNQELKLFSSRYTQADFSPQAVEINISNTGLVTLTGFPVGSDFSGL